MSRLTLGKFQIANHSKHWPVCRKRHSSQPLQKPCPCKKHSSRKPVLIFNQPWPTCATKILCVGIVAYFALVELMHTPYQANTIYKMRGKKVWNSRHWATVQIDFESHAFTALKHKQNHHYDLVSQVHFLRKVFSPLKFTPIIWIPIKHWVKEKIYINTQMMNMLQMNLT